MRPDSAKIRGLAALHVLTAEWKPTGLDGRAEPEGSGQPLERGMSIDFTRTSEPLGAATIELRRCR
jgi:hypothetical protein